MANQYSNVDCALVAKSVTPLDNPRENKKFCKTFKKNPEHP